MDDPTAPLNASFTELLRALSDNRSTISISVFPPRDLVDGDQAELLGRYTVLELPEGSIASPDDMARADFVLVGGLVVKNRDGQVYGYGIAREPHAMVHLGCKFDIGQRVGFLRKRGDVHIAARGEILTVTQYRDREPVYCVTLDEATVGLFGGVREAYADEGELTAVDVDAGAEDPDAGSKRYEEALEEYRNAADAIHFGRKAEPAARDGAEERDPLHGLDAASARPETWKDRHNSLYALLRGIDALREIVGRPIPMGIRDLADMGHIPARHMAKEIGREFTLLRALVAYEMDAIMAENVVDDSRQAEPDVGAKRLRGAAIDTLRCLYMHGPTFDGDVPSKSGRDELAAGGLIERGCDGYQWLTASGVAASIALGFHHEKEKRRQGRRRPT